MTDAPRRNRRRWSIGSALFALTFAAVFFSWAWLWAWWVFPDVPEQDRTAYFHESLDRDGVAARLDGGRMTRLRRGDVAEVGASKCARATECSLSGRRRRASCWEVAVTFTCAYAVKDGSGHEATAILTIRSNSEYRDGVTVPGSPKRFRVSGLDLNEADDKLCELGHGCRPPGDQGERSSEPQAQAQAVKSRVPPSDDTNKAAAPANAAAREFQDCAGGICAPVMVALPQGEYLAGEGPAVDRKPRQIVVVGYQLAVGKFEVTFAEWDACVADRGCELRPDDEKWGRNRRPVIHVTWDAVTSQYLPWLNRKLGLSGAGAYRLPTEAEWEYAARAVTSSTAPHTRYAWGDDVGANRANCAGCGSEWDGWKTAPVGSFAPNAFGLHDMHGNVEEWVQDCEPSSRRASGAPLESRHCFVRGGAFSHEPGALRSSYRLSTFSISYGRNHGFRLARTLAPRP
jgi:formylglycine-generating enzyme required for sulfatase activity